MPGAQQAKIRTKANSKRRHLRVANPHAFRVGESVVVSRPSTEAWIHAINMDMIPLPPGRVINQWNPADYGMAFERTVTAVDDQGITLDIPMVQALEKSYGGGEVAACKPGNPCARAGVERLRLVSAYQVGNEKTDEAHASFGVEFGYSLDCWLREVSALHFTMGCVNAKSASRRITIQACASFDPVSQITGGRRYPFTVDGQQVLVQRCYSRNARHDFVTGGRLPGPNSFVDCLSEISHADSGPHQRWAAGILYDNIAAAQLKVIDRANGGSGQGWAGTCHVFWNCTGEIVCQQPPTGINWAIGCTGTKGKPPWPRAGGERETLPRADGVWESWGTPVTPRSLYLSQLKDRLGIGAVRAATIPEQLSGPITKLLHCRYSSEPVYPACPAPSTAATASALLQRPYGSTQ